MADEYDYSGDVTTDDSVLSDGEDKQYLEEIAGEKISSEEEFSDGFGFDTSDSDGSDAESKPKIRSDKPLPLPPGANLDKLFARNVKINVDNRSTGKGKRPITPPPPISSQTTKRRIVIKRTPANNSQSSSSSSGSSSSSNVSGPKIRTTRISRNEKADREAKIKEERIDSAVKTIHNILDKEDD